MEFHSKYLAAALITGALTFGTSGAALADDDDIHIYYNEIADSAGDLSADDLSDQDLQLFLFAAQSVSDFRAEAQEQLEAGQGDASEIIANTDADMVEAVRTAGLEPEEFRQIGYLIQNDADVRERLNRVAGSL